MGDPVPLPGTLSPCPGPDPCFPFLPFASEYLFYVPVLVLKLESITTGHILCFFFFPGGKSKWQRLIARGPPSTALRPKLRCMGAPLLEIRAEAQHEHRTQMLSGPWGGGGSAFHFSRGVFHFHSFQGSFVSGNHQKPRRNSRFLKRTMVETNGESTPRTSP